MSQGPSAVPKLGFDGFDLDLRSGELRKNSRRVKLQLQPLRVLAFLAARAGQVVTREEIRRHVWGQETFVDYEQGLNYCIRQIRAALGEDAKAPRYIETCPRRGYRFIAPVVELGRSAAALDEERVMLAVLPLDSLSDQGEQEYFSDGLTDEIITELGRLCPERLGVIARTSAMRYKRTVKGIDQIGRELSVDYIVEGAVRRDGNRVRITAQLIRVSDQTHVWADRYERELRDLLLLQSEVAAAIAGQVHIKLVRRSQPRSAALRPISPEVHEACLKGRYFWNRRTRDSLHRALEFFTTAINEDPEYPAAFAGLADVYLTMLDFRYLPPAEALAQATAAAVNALRLDEELAEAQTSLAHAKLHALEWAEAEQRFRRAIELSAGYATAHFYYANLLTAVGRFEEAIAEARHALKLDPVSVAAESNLAILLHHAGRDDEALDSCRKAIELEPSLPRLQDDLGRIFLQQGLVSDAIEFCRKAVVLSGREPRFLASLGYAYAATGENGLAREILAELSDISSRTYVDPYDIAIIHAGLGDKEQAFHMLERSCEERSGALPFVNVDLRFANLRADPRFAALLTRVGLTQAPEAGSASPWRRGA